MQTICVESGFVPESAWCQNLGSLYYVVQSLWITNLTKVMFSFPCLYPNNPQGKCCAHFIEEENEAQRGKLLLQSYINHKGQSLDLNLGLTTI